MKVLVTGASGFIGRTLCAKLRGLGHEVAACSRSQAQMPGIFYVRSPELGPNAEWRDILVAVDAVVHLAGLSHVPSGKSDPESEKYYLHVNAEGSRRLAEQCARGGVKHFLLLSSCHAVAAKSNEVLTDSIRPHPVSAYGRSKLAAEEGIRSVLANSSCSWTILRSPLVYGPGNESNFGALLKLLRTGLPLPLASVRNKRSFIYVENLVDLIASCLLNPKAFGKIFLPSDGEDVSTPDLIRAIARANADLEENRREKTGFRAKTRHTPRRSLRILPCPEGILKFVGRLLALGALEKLTCSLYVDSEPLRRDLGWKPPFTMNEGLRRTLGKTIGS